MTTLRYLAPGTSPLTTAGAESLSRPLHGPETTVPARPSSGLMTLAREGSIALRLSRFATEVAPLFVATGATAHLSRTTLGAAPTWLLVVFGVAWLLTAASAVWHLRRGSYVPWSSCRARPFQTFCLLALNAAPWLPLEHLRAQSAIWLALLPAGIPSWICGLAVALVFVMMAWPMQRTCGFYGRPAVFP